jgi:tetratricopeptide (TPR) repeat protein/KaiC/GvpD/RAD55 family RecA-like ATPase
LEKAYAEKIDQHLGELALHFLEGGDKGKALDYFLRAGEKAAGIYANAEAASYFQSALRLLEEKEGDLREKGHVLERLGDIKEFVGEHDASMKYWNEALSLWKQLDEKEKTARAHRRIASILWELGETEKAKDHLDKALRILETEPESVELASLYSDKARWLWQSGDITSALSWAEKALELGKKLDAFEVIATSYTNSALVFSSTGETKKAVECLEKALKIALDNGYMETACRIYNNLTVSLPAGENEKRLGYIEKGYELAKKVGSVDWISWLGVSLAYTYAGMGNVDKAFSLIEESVALDRKTGSMNRLWYSTSALGLANQVMGEWDKSEQYCKEALNISQKINSLTRIAQSYGSLGWLYFEKGEYVKAREFYEKCVEILEKAGAKADQIGYSQDLAWIHIELGEIEKANSLIDNVFKFALEEENKGLIAGADALKAMLFRAQKKWEESIEYFEKSLKEFEALGARQWNIYTFAKMVLYEYARAYLERDQEGDREKAQNLLNQALEISQKMGAKKDIAKIEAMMIHLETGPQTVSVPEPIVKVSEGVPRNITSGYADLDNLLLGGIPQNYAVILTSPSCDERDLLVRSFLETGTRKGEVTFYLTMNPGIVKVLAEEFQSNFCLFVCNPQADAIVKSSPNVFKLKGVENLTEISIALTSAIHKLDSSQKGPRRICIGLVSDVLLQHHAVQTRRWLAALIPELKSAGFTTLAVIDPRMHPPEELYAILGLFEGEINVTEKETEKGPGKFLKIKKMSNQEYLEDEILLKKGDLHRKG